MADRAMARDGARDVEALVAVAGGALTPSRRDRGDHPARLVSAVAGACSDEQRATLLEAGRRMVAEQGAEAVVLAGTDLGFALDGSVDPGYAAIDALAVHVALLADLALGRATLLA
jgi:aspartate/glutamate racemase